MNLLLDYTQRLNLHALMGGQRATLDDMRMLWHLQDRIGLSEEEKASINYRTTQANGMQQILWDTAKVPPPADYEFTQDEFNRITRMLKEWQLGFLIGADRQWLEPLMAQLDKTQAGAPPLPAARPNSGGLAGAHGADGVHK